MPPGGWKTTSCLKWAILRLSVGKTWGRKARVDPAKGDAPASQAPHFKAALPLFLGLVLGAGCQVVGDEHGLHCGFYPGCPQLVFVLFGPGEKMFRKLRLRCGKVNLRVFMVHFCLQDFENMICPEGAWPLGTDSPAQSDEELIQYHVVGTFNIFQILPVVPHKAVAEVSE